MDSRSIFLHLAEIDKGRQLRICLASVLHHPGLPVQGTQYSVQSIFLYFVLRSLYFVLFEFRVVQDMSDGKDIVVSRSGVTEKDAQSVLLTLRGRYKAFSPGGKSPG